MESIIDNVSFHLIKMLTNNGGNVKCDMPCYVYCCYIEWKFNKSI